MQILIMVIDILLILWGIRALMKIYSIDNLDKSDRAKKISSVYTYSHHSVISYQFYQQSFAIILVR